MLVIILELLLWLVLLLLLLFRVSPGSTLSCWLPRSKLASHWDALRVVTLSQNDQLELVFMGGASTVGALCLSAALGTAASADVAQAAQQALGATQRTGELWYGGHRAYSQSSKRSQNADSGASTKRGV